MIRNFFDQLIKCSKRTFKDLRKVEADQGNDYSTGCLVDYPYFKENY